MGEGVRSHVRTCAICGRTVRLPNLARRSHNTGRGFAITDTHALSHLTREEKATWWTLPTVKWSPLAQERAQQRARERAAISALRVWDAEGRCLAGHVHFARSRVSASTAKSIVRHAIQKCEEKESNR